MPPICVDGTCDICCSCSTLCHSNYFCQKLGRIGARSCIPQRTRAFATAIWVGLIQIALCIYCMCSLSPNVGVLRYTYWGLWNIYNESTVAINTSSSPSYEMEVHMGITHVTFHNRDGIAWPVHWRGACEGKGHSTSPYGVDEQYWLSSAGLCGDCVHDAYSIRYSVAIMVLTSLIWMRANIKRLDSKEDLPIWKFSGVCSCIVLSGCSIWSYQILINHCFAHMPGYVGTCKLSQWLGPGVFAELLVLLISIVNGVLHMVMPVPEVNLWGDPSEVGFDKAERLISVGPREEITQRDNNYSFSFTATSDC